MSLKDDKQEIRNRVDTKEILIGLAEESSELTQAALKLRRVFDGGSPTPKTEDEAIDNLYEEIADVMLHLDILRINMKSIEPIKEYKANRWVTRLIENDKRTSGDKGDVDRPVQTV